MAYSRGPSRYRLWCRTAVFHTSMKKCLYDAPNFTSVKILPSYSCLELRRSSSRKMGTLSSRSPNENGLGDLLVLSSNPELPAALGTELEQRGLNQRFGKIHCASTAALAEEALSQTFAGTERDKVGTGDEVGATNTEKERKSVVIMLADPGLVNNSLLSLPALKDLAWMQSTWAGVDSLMLRVSRRDYRLTRLGRVFSPLMAEYVLGAILAHERSFVQYYRQQTQRLWRQESYRRMRDLTIGVMGAGEIGQAVGAALRALGAKVVGLKRSIPVDIPQNEDERRDWLSSQGMDEIVVTCQFSGVEDAMRAFLPKIDVLVNILPSTSDTRGLLNENRLRFCSPERRVHLVNVGRGDLLSEQSILEALEKEWIAATTLDVLFEEPLPAESRLWGHPKVFITPHVAAASFPDDVASFFADNLELFIQNSEQKLLNEVQWDREY